jgi:LuxR family transcriptional regulator, quorum-sensing system regulator LasR
MTRDGPGAHKREKYERKMTAATTFTPRVAAFALPADDTARRLHMGALASELGMETATYIGPFKRGRAGSSPKIFSNGPQLWLERYAECDYFRHDPLVRYARTSTIPTWWDRSICESEPEVAVVETGERFGLRAGLVFPVCAADGNLGILSFASHSISLSESDAQSAFAKGLLMATLMHRSVRDTLIEAGQAIKPQLTRREVECLKWIALGKSSWEISHIIGISEHGVLYHIRNVMAKYGVSNRHVAVRRAMEDGAIDWAAR